MRTRRFAGVLGATLLLSLAIAVPVAASSVTPVFVSGNPYCADEGGSGPDLGFDHGVKIDPPKAGTFAVGGGTVTISNVDTSVNPATFTWSSSGVTVLAVVVKGGDGANVYSYNPPASTGDSGLHAPNGFSHINICYNEEPPSGYLKIEKEVDGGQASGDFTFHADCGNGGSFDVTITFPDPGSVTIDDIPAGSVCDVTETGMPDAPVGFHWGEPTVTENPATIKDEDTVWVHFTNHLIPDDGSLKITKAVIGGPEGYTGSFDVHVDCGNDGTFDKTINFPDPGFVTIGDLTAGAQCTVTETGMPDAPDGFVFGEPDVDGSPATIVSDGTAAVTVTNHLTEIPPETGSVTVTKVVSGAPEGFTGSFDVRVTCAGGDPIDRTIVWPDPGFVTIDGLPAGALCAVIETGRSDPPDGFQWAGALFAGTVTIAANQTAESTVTNILTEQQAAPALGLEKSNNAPLVGTVQTADEGATVTYTLNYTLTDGPVTLGVLKDVLPVGVTYVAGTASNNAEFEFDNYDAGTRTLTWTADSVSTSGSVTYQATVDAGAAALEQPLTNTATIDSEETSPVSDSSDVSVFAVVQPHGPTPPPTDSASPGETSASGLSLMIVTLLMLGVAGGILAFAPTSIRKRKR